MGGNGDEQLAMFDILVAQAVVFRTEDQRDSSRLCRSDDFWREFAGGLIVPAVQPRSAGRADHESAVSNGLAKCFITFRLAQNVSAVDRHGPRPEAARACFSDDRPLARAASWGGGSEEDTSELPSRPRLPFRLLLVKKKTILSD